MAVELVPPVAETIELRPRRFDLRSLWRLTAWGGAAALGLTAAVFATQTETGSRRLSAILSASSVDLPVRSVATVPIPVQDAQVAKLEAQVRTLAADRDRLAERVASLEHNVEDMTGSIRRVAFAAQPSMPPILSMVPAPGAPPTTLAVKEPETTQSTPLPPTDSIEPAVAAPPEQGAENTHDAVPLPPTRMASLPPDPAKSEFGVALASSSSMEILHLQWSALKANYGPLLGSLRPIAAREQRGTATYYRLVLGPLPNLGAATKLCAKLTAARAPCHAGKFSGEPL